MTDTILFGSPFEWVSADKGKQYTYLNDKTTTTIPNLHTSAGPQHVISYFERKINVIRQKRFKVSNFRRYFKTLRKVLHLNKNPKRKGYDKFLTDEEKR